ncbi:histidinol-phosphate transaminase [Homoserinimonas aerilata]|uniref:histidinol-phosphate transaminase n=1 Tax=Homoserinimonas aerilata TaxID=1162970 RepID=UPI001FE6C142|nr:histidinol-phosphate transaminase [Homoserinimonas aerilata]
MTTAENPPVRIRPEIAATQPYRQGRQAAPDAFKLSSNESPFAPHPAVTAAIAEATINRYPDASAQALRDVLAARHGVSSDMVHVGAGSVSILSQLIQAVAGPGDEVIYSWRSFEAYPGLVTVAGANSVQVPSLTDHRHDLPAMAAAVTERTRAIIVCSPNNPTGTIVTEDEFTAFMAEVPRSVLVMFDEAYIEFAGPDAARGPALLAEHPNLVVLKTFSKAYGLAGLRIGYGLGAPYILDAARATAIPLSVTEQGQRAALAALAHEDDYRQQLDEIIARREQITDALIAQGWKVPRSHGNFVWLPTGDFTTAAAELFMERGIVARALGEGIRISIGEAESVDTLLKAAAEVVAKLPSAAQ